MRPLDVLWRELLERPEGPFAFRFYLQPVMAILLATRDGIRDAKAGRTAYLWSLFTVREGRRERLRHGWSSVRRVFLLAIAMDLAYQLIVLRGLRPLTTMLVAAVLAIFPYLLARGPANREFRRLAGRRAVVH